MQKICLLAFTLLIFLLSFSFISSPVYAASEINYELPYPGLLPDSPLYFLRVTRDRVVSFLISSPLKKAEFDLLQADKRLNAGLSLLDKGKTALALSTVSKAENYFEESVNGVEEADREGMNTSSLKGKMKLAIIKHREVLESLAQKAKQSFKEGFEKEAKRTSNFELRLSR